jgi:hypothetical protein
MVKARVQPPSQTPPPAAKKGSHGPAGADLGRQIGERLRTMFHDVLTEPVPEKFRALLEELERKSKEEGG